MHPSTLPQPPKGTSVLVSRYLMRSQDELMPLAFTSPPRGELELYAFGRSWFETNANCMFVAQLAHHRAIEYY